MSAPIAETKCPNCGASAVAMGECPYCGKIVPVHEKASDGVKDVLITAPGQRVVVNFLKAQHERAKGHMGVGCAVLLFGGFGGGLLVWYLGGLLGHPVLPALVTFVIGAGSGIALGIREDRLLCENEIVPGLRQRMAEEGVDRAEAQRLASEALPADSTLLQAVLTKL
jgi:hypothetical protein